MTLDGVALTVAPHLRRLWRWEGLSLAVLVLFLASYTLEHLLFAGQVDLTYPLGSIAAGTALIARLLIGRLRRPRVVDLAVLMFGLLVLASPVIHGVELSIGLRIAVGSILPYFLARLYTLPDETVARVVRSVVIVVSSVYAALLLGEVVTNTGVLERVSLGGANPITAAEVVGFGTVAAAVTRVGGASKRPWVLALAAMLCLSAQVVALGSRGSVGAALAAIAVAVLLRWQQRSRGFWFFLLLLAVVVTSVSMWGGVANRFRPESIMSDPGVIGSAQYLGRAQLWQLSLETFKSAPLLGVGLGVVYSHNLFLEVAASTGLVGLGIMLLAFLAVPWRRIIKASRRSDAVLLVLALFLFTLAYRQTSFSLQGHKSLFALFGLLVGMGQRPNDESVR